MNTPEPISPIVSSEWSLIRLVILFVVLLGIGTGVFAILTLRDIRGKATTALPTPTPFVEVVSPPKTSLTAPYMRLVTAKAQYGFGTAVPVDVYINSNGKEIMEADVSISYDPDIFELVGDISKTDIFKVIQIDESPSGTLTFSLFVNPQVGHAPIVTVNEVKVATIPLKTRSLGASQTDIQLEFTTGKRGQSGLYEYAQSRPVSFKNILSSVESATVAVAP